MQLVTQKGVLKHSMRAVLIIPLALSGGLLYSCHRQTPVATTQSGAQPSSVLVQHSRTGEQVRQIIADSGLDLVRMRRDAIACGAERSTGNTRVVPQPANPADGYGAWLHYIADHIRSNIAFDSSYSVISANALDTSGWFDPTGDTCLNLTRSHDLLSPSDADPSQVGQSLFKAFSECDQPTRELAATLIAP